MKLPTRAPASAEGTGASRPGFPPWAWWAVALATFLFAVPLTSPWWSTVLRAEIPDSPEDAAAGPAGLQGNGSPEAPPVPESTIKVVLHLPRADQPGLAAVEREIPYERGVSAQIRAAVSQLGTAGEGAPALLPEGARLLDVAFTREGMVYLDFTPELDAGRAVGAEEEARLVEGVVTTVTDNFAAVQGVMILVDGKAPTPIHLDLTRVFRRGDPAFASGPDPAPESTTGSAPSPAPAARPATTPADF